MTRTLEPSAASNPKGFHLVTVGMSPTLVVDLWDRIAQRVEFRVSHIAHPSFDRETWGKPSTLAGIHFLRDHIRAPHPTADRELLASLETDDVPTIHNMILGDRFVSKLPYEEALAYATYLAQRLIALYQVTQPSAIVGGFDDLHGSLGLAVARRMNIPWLAMYFGPLPSGSVAFCSGVSAGSMLTLSGSRRSEMRAEAARILTDFEQRKVRAAVYIPPEIVSLSFFLRHFPFQMKSLLRSLRRWKLRGYLKYTDYAATYSVYALFREALRNRWNLWRLRHQELVSVPGNCRYAFFGLHMQPESSIDVMAHFFSDQLYVIELIARSLPPTHTLFVKLHKSDPSNYSPKQLRQLSRFPGVRIVSPYADTMEFIRHSDLVFSIQGTIGLEAALLGKPVIMFAESATKGFPSVSTVGRTIDLPALVRSKLADKTPTRGEIIDALSSYLAPFYPASCNDWTVRPTEAEIDRYVEAFELLREHIGHNASLRLSIAER